MQLKKGDKVDKTYQIVDFIGSGAYGAVYAVKDLVLNRPYVLKIEIRQGENSPLKKEAHLLRCLNELKMDGIPKFI